MANSTRLYSNRSLIFKSLSLANGVVSHIKLFVGFSTLQAMPSLSSASTASATKAYRTFASATRAASAKLNVGRPSGKSSDRNGLGSNVDGFPFSNLRISLAREAVPHGGAKWTYTTRCDRTNRQNSSWPIFVDRSSQMHFVLGLSLLSL